MFGSVCPQFAPDQPGVISISTRAWPFDAKPLRALWPVQGGPSAAHHLGRLRKG